MARDSFIGQYDSQRSTADPKRWSPILVSNYLVCFCSTRFYECPYDDFMIL